MKRQFSTIRLSWHPARDAILNKLPTIVSKQQLLKITNNLLKYTDATQPKLFKVDLNYLTESLFFNEATLIFSENKSS
jgi:hypothetical protein